MTSTQPRHAAESGTADFNASDLLRGAARAIGGALAHRARRGVGPGERLPLNGRVVFITGAAHGLGAEFARECYSRGASVSLVGRRLAPVQELAEQLGDRAAALEADVSDFEALHQSAKATAERFGGIDVVIADAGIAPPSDSILTVDPAEFERTADIDLLGQWRTVGATLPYVIERRGHIVVIASVYSFINGFLDASYAASNAGVEQLVHALRVELAPHQTTAGVAYLGFVDTNLARDVSAKDPIDDIRVALPAFVTNPISAGQAAHAVVNGIAARSSRVGAPGWVLPAARVRSLLSSLDAVLTHLIATVRRAEASVHERNR
ncbi:short-chain dehydrogenase/reductase [Nocardia sp. NPDC050412]|uniref:short-chain dehydrogenase/reductase n=1 Tax=Nocardia sp. NPDC050412 TaxID=3364320 RepID=UPI0037B0E342